MSGKGNPNTRPLPPLSEKDIARFHSLVKRGLPDECWPWLLKGTDHGYGIFSFAGESFKAHRVAMFLATGVDRVDRMGCHGCNNPICCNPTHLYAGTGYDNAMDRIEAGTQQTGESHGRARLTEANVREIRRAWHCGEATMKELAERFHVCVGVISKIVYRKTWVHVI